MKPETPTQEPRREKIGFVNGKFDNIKRELDRVCDFANEKIIGTMQLLHLLVNVKSVIRYCENPEMMMSDHIEMALKQNQMPGATKLLNEVLSERVRQQAEESISIPLGNAKTRYPQFLELAEVCPNEEEEQEADEEEADEQETAKPRYRLQYSNEAIMEECNIYITDPALLNAFDRYHAALKAMNEFFKGKAPDAWTGLREFFWLNNKGEVVAAENIDFSRFI